MTRKFTIALLLLLRCPTVDGVPALVGAGFYPA